MTYASFKSYASELYTLILALWDRPETFAKHEVDISFNDATKERLYYLRASRMNGLLPIYSTESVGMYDATDRRTLDVDETMAALKAFFSHTDYWAYSGQSTFQLDDLKERLSNEGSQAVGSFSVRYKPSASNLILGRSMTLVAYDKPQEQLMHKLALEYDDLFVRDDMRPWHYPKANEYFSTYDFEH